MKCDHSKISIDTSELNWPFPPQQDMVTDSTFTAKIEIRVEKRYDNCLHCMKHSLELLTNGKTFTNV